MTDAVIGVIGTIAGTILGWILSALSSKMGSLKMTISNQEICFLKKNEDILSPGTEVKYNDIPDGIKICFDLGVYNNYAKMNGINHVQCMLKFGRKKHYLKGDFREISNFLNIEPYKYQAEHVYHISNISIPLDVSKQIKNGYTLYLSYKVNNGLFEHKKRIKREK